MLSGVGRARGPPLPFAFYPTWQQQVTKNDREAKSRNRAKYAQSGLASPERILWPKQPPHQGEQPHPLPRSGSVQQTYAANTATSSLFHPRRQWRGVADGRRYARQSLFCQPKLVQRALEHARPDPPLVTPTAAGGS